MHDILRLVIDGGGDGDGSAVEAQAALGARLAAGGGVEDGLVEQDAAALVDADDLGVAGFEIGVVAEEQGRQQALTSSNTAGTWAVRSSSQSGTGRPFSRRNSGLKSFDW